MNDPNIKIVGADGAPVEGDKPAPAAPQTREPWTVETIYGPFVYQWTEEDAGRFAHDPGKCLTIAEPGTGHVKMFVTGAGIMRVVRGRPATVAISHQQVLAMQQEHGHRNGRRR